MLISTLWAAIPSRRTLFSIVISSLLGGALAIGISTWLHSPAEPPPSPQPPHDPHFVHIGQAYITALGKTYASAWDAGAKGLDAGQDLSTSLNAVAKAWSTNRTQLFDQMVTPEFGKLIPETMKDADITPQERAAMAAAWRGFALGLRK
jgi:hypothetical protein